MRCVADIYREGSFQKNEIKAICASFKDEDAGWICNDFVNMFIAFH